MFCDCCVCGCFNISDIKGSQESLHLSVPIKPIDVPNRDPPDSQYDQLQMIILRVADNYHALSPNR
jgi:hypothetical protein